MNRTNEGVGGWMRAVFMANCESIAFGSCENRRHKKLFRRCFQHQFQVQAQNFFLFLKLFFFGF